MPPASRLNPFRHTPQRLRAQLDYLRYFASHPTPIPFNPPPWEVPQRPFQTFRCPIPPKTDKPYYTKPPARPVIDTTLRTDSGSERSSSVQSTPTAVPGRNKHVRRQELWKGHRQSVFFEKHAPATPKEPSPPPTSSGRDFPVPPPGPTPSPRLLYWSPFPSVPSANPAACQVHETAQNGLDGQQAAIAMQIWRQQALIYQAAREAAHYGLAWQNIRQQQLLAKYVAGHAARTGAVWQSMFRQHDLAGQVYREAAQIGFAIQCQNYARQVYREAAQIGFGIQCQNYARRVYHEMAAKVTMWTTMEKVQRNLARQAAVEAAQQALQRLAPNHRTPSPDSSVSRVLDIQGVYDSPVSETQYDADVSFCDGSLESEHVEYESSGRLSTILEVTEPSQSMRPITVASVHDASEESMHTMTESSFGSLDADTPPPEDGNIEWVEESSHDDHILDRGFWRRMEQERREHQEFVRNMQAQWLVEYGTENPDFSNMSVVEDQPPAPATAQGAEAAVVFEAAVHEPTPKEKALAAKLEHQEFMKSIQAQWLIEYGTENPDFSNMTGAQDDSLDLLLADSEPPATEPAAEPTAKQVVAEPVMVQPVAVQAAVHEPTPKEKALAAKLEHQEFMKSIQAQWLIEYGTENPDFSNMTGAKDASPSLLLADSEPLAPEPVYIESIVQETVAAEPSADEAPEPVAGESVEEAFGRALLAKYCKPLDLDNLFPDRAVIDADEGLPLSNPVLQHFKSMRRELPRRPADSTLLHQATQGPVFNPASSKSSFGWKSLFGVTAAAVVVAAGALAWSWW